MTGPYAAPVHASPFNDGSATDGAALVTAIGAGLYALETRPPTNVLTLGVKGDVRTVTDAAITTGTTALSSTAAAFTSADVGKRVQVVNAEVGYNVRGAWAGTTVYAQDDLVTFSGQTFICRIAHTSATTLQVNNWAVLPYAGQVARTLLATIASVSGGVATLDTAASRTVSGATLTYGTDDSAVCAALPAGHYYFPGARTYFLSEWFMASNTSVAIGPAAVFKLPANLNSDASVFRLLTANRNSATMLSNIHIAGKFTIDMTELTPPIGYNVRGIHVLNCQDWSIDTVYGVGIPGGTGNVLVVGSNQAGAQYSSHRGRVNLITNSLVRGLGSSCVQQTAGYDHWYGTLWTDGAVAGRFEMDGHAGDVSDNVVVDLAHNTGATLGLCVNSTVTLKPHANALSNVRIGAIISEGVADALGIGYDPGGSLENVLVARLRASGGGAGINNNNNTNTYPNFVVLGGDVDSCGTGTLYRAPKSNPGSAYCVLPGMTLYSCRATNSTASGFKDVFQTSIVTGSKLTLIDCEATGNAFNGVLVDKIELINIIGGQYTSNGTGAFGGGSASVTFNVSGLPDTRSNGGGGVIQSGSLAVFNFVDGTPHGAATGDLAGSYPNPTVDGLNGVNLAGLATGLLKNTTATGVPTIAAAADVPVVAAGGTGPLNAADPNNVTLDANGHIASTVLPNSAQREVLTRRTGAFAETISRRETTTATAQVLGQLTVASIVLLKGQIVTKIVFLSGSTGLNTPTNQWFALWSSSLGLIGTTTDDLTTAWSASSEKSLNMLANYTVLADGLFYVSCLVAATAANTLIGSGPTFQATGLAPVLNGRDTTHTGLTNLASCPATATLAANAVLPYAWVG